MMIVDVVNILTQILQIIETKKIQYSHTDVTEEGSEVDSSRRQIKYNRSCTKDKEEDPEDGKDK